MNVKAAVVQKKVINYSVTPGNNMRGNDD